MFTPEAAETKVGRTWCSFHLRMQDGNGANFLIGSTRNQDRYEKWTGKDTNFLVQDLRTFPFAFPHISEEKEDGSQIVTYPPQLTEDLLEDLYDSHTTRKRQANDALGKDKGRKKYKKIDYSKLTVNVKW